MALILPSPKGLSRNEKSVFNIGSQLWNGLQENGSNIDSLKAFKKEIGLLY